MTIIHGQPRDLGDGFTVNRVLPQIARRSVGPFVFFDHFGPVDFPPGKGVDVRPHPHIGLSTLTWLFEGSQMHRDSLGSAIEITPGDVNWMTAGRGIVHSERTGPETRARGHRLHGLQSWIGLPTAHEETDPAFQNVKSANLPHIERNGARLTLIAGAAFGARSPVKTFSPIFYAEAVLAPGAEIALPDYLERAVFAVEDGVTLDGAPVPSGALGLADDGVPGIVRNAIDANAVRIMLLGGAPLDGPRHLWWNFVSSSKPRIEQAKRDWQAMALGRITGDDEFIPLPP